jgi:pSer/pThr/pTyr-binding forkhead associated (FHA) protein
MNKGRFSQVERRIEQLVEGSFARLFAGRLHPREVAVHLARALEDNAQVSQEGIEIAPNVFTVQLNPDDLAAMTQAQPHLVQSLAETVVDFATRVDMQMETAPRLELVPDASLPLRSIVVTAYHERAASRATQMMQPVEPISTPPSGPRNPQLILQGMLHIPLTRHVINIGRKHDNHIVIDDQRVSRAHAQLRLRFGRYVLYDLGSSGGTFVNDHAVQECILKPGDVISLAGVPLVYIEDEPSTGHDLYDGTKTETKMRRPGTAKPRKDDDPTI